MIKVVVILFFMQLSTIYAGYNISFDRGMQSIDQEELDEQDIMPKNFKLSDESRDVDIRNSNNETPLHLAAKECDINLILFLLREGADPNVQDKNGDTPVHKYAENCPYLGTEQENSFFVPLVFEKFIQFGANLNIKNGVGRTVQDMVMDF